MQVSVEDDYGNVVGTDNSSVTVAIGTNPGGGTLGGTVTVAAVNGVATFSNLSINKAGTGYTLTATDGSLSGATSNSFNATPVASKATVGLYDSSSSMFMLRDSNDSGFADQCCCVRRGRGRDVAYRR